jgi:hypothetical protein
MDDELYCKADSQQLPCQAYYTQLVGKTISTKYKKIKLDEFAKIYMVWQAICGCGLRSTSFVTSKIMNQDVYIKECLQKRLQLFARKHRVFKTQSNLEKPVSTGFLRVFWVFLCFCMFLRVFS